MTPVKNTKGNRTSETPRPGRISRIGRGSIVFEIRGAWIAACQSRARAVLIERPVRRSADPRGWAGDEAAAVLDGDEFLLPAPECVKEALLAAGMRAGSCTLILPRREWLLGLGRRPGGHAGRLRAAAAIEAEAAAHAFDEPFVHGCAVEPLSKKDSGKDPAARVAWCALPLKRYERLTEWAAACGLALRDVIPSPYAAGLGAPVHDLLLAGYPDGSWELHGFESGRLTNTYAGERVDAGGDELVQALTYMILGRLRSDEGDMASGAGDELILRADSVRLKLAHGLPPDHPLRDRLHDHVEACASRLARAGVRASIELVEAEFLALSGSGTGWPSFSLGAAAAPARGARRRTALIDAKRRREAPESPFRRTAAAAAFAAMITVTAVLGWVHHQSEARLAEVAATSADLTSDFRELDPLRAQLREQQARLDELQGFFAKRDVALRALAAAEDALPPGTRIEDFLVDGDVVTMTVTTPSAADALAGLERSPSFTRVAVRTAIQGDEIDGRRMERVGLEARFAEGGVGAK